MCGRGSASFSALWCTPPVAPSMMFVPAAALLKYWQISPFLHSLSFPFRLQIFAQITVKCKTQQFVTNCIFLECIGNYR